jgi:hypothetical protein
VCVAGASAVRPFEKLCREPSPNDQVALEYGCVLVLAAGLKRSDVPAAMRPAGGVILGTIVPDELFSSQVPSPLLHSLCV